MQIIQLVLTGIVIPLVGWILSETVKTGKGVAVLCSQTDTQKGQIKELFDRVLELEKGNCKNGK